ncbi:cyclase family protein [Maridesulfovibrio sp.]|uniref:cyclase family protein n=1 Tax=Maridesulfovibrio sp. TaxID=2795000 RepID=UPI002A18B93B|nr:cyclase family protein [Maridesulfovibrio sp.]
MKLLDLTHPITENMPVFPGSPLPKLQPIAAVETEGYREHSISITTHTGTHIDAPAHILNEGLTLDQMDIGCFFGSAAVLDCRRPATEGRQIEIDDLREFEEIISENDFLLLYTGWDTFWGTEKYYSGFPALSEDAAVWLSDFGLKGIGIDTISADRADSQDLPVHSILLENGTIIIENLTGLNALIGLDFIFSCMPLKFAGADGSPVRAVALLTS